MFDCTCNTQNSLLLNQHNGDDAPEDYNCTFLITNPATPKIEATYSAFFVQYFVRNSNFRRVRIVANYACYLPHVRVSVCLSTLIYLRGSHWTDLHIM